jgi:mannose-6-phosphate isomerase-like protein (cupin superfamily)
MSAFATMKLPDTPTIIAPDGSDVRVLLQLSGGSMAHFELGAGAVSDPVLHQTVEEIWFVVKGSGEMWRRQGDREEIVALAPGICVTIPRGTSFQFKASASEAVAAVGITMPPWPGEGEALPTEGPWVGTRR